MRLEGTLRVEGSVTALALVRTLLGMCVLMILERIVGIEIPGALVAMELSFRIRIIAAWLILCIDYIDVAIVVCHVRCWRGC